MEVGSPAYLRSSVGSFRHNVVLLVAAFDRACRCEQLLHGEEMDMSTLDSMIAICRSIGPEIIKIAKHLKVLRVFMVNKDITDKLLDATFEDAAQHLAVISNHRGALVQWLGRIVSSPPFPPIRPLTPVSSTCVTGADVISAFIVSFADGLEQQSPLVQTLFLQLFDYAETVPHIVDSQS